MHKYKGFWIHKVRRYGYIYYKVDNHKEYFSRLTDAKAYVDSLTVVLTVRWANGAETEYRYKTVHEAKKTLIDMVSEYKAQITDFEITE